MITIHPYRPRSSPPSSAAGGLAPLQGRQPSIANIYLAHTRNESRPRGEDRGGEGEDEGCIGSSGGGPRGEGRESIGDGEVLRGWRRKG